MREGAPRELIAELSGRVWRKTVEKGAVARHRADHAVISTQLYEGKTLVHVLHDARPEEGFEPVEPNLEDVYFSILRTPAAAREELHAA